jgi:hypothetical protein
MPSPEELRIKLPNTTLPEYHEANGHLHTPYSFSAFDELETMFLMAKNEGISVLGINDFFVTDGYEPFYRESIIHRVFPLFNIEFIGLLKEEQKKGIRINDPNNPGRIYFSGKGLDYPFNPGQTDKKQLNKVITASQNQIKAMISRLNQLIYPISKYNKLTYEEIKERYAYNLVRERHLAKAVRILAVENYQSSDTQLHFIEALYGGKKSKTGMSNPAQLENEIRSNLLKAGGPAFVEEDDSSFPDLNKIIGIIVNAGGIPCYPVLLDDLSGNCTEFECEPEKLYYYLMNLNIGCIEFIPGRNDITMLKKYSEFFSKKGFLISFGTEHNTPEMIPLKITPRGGKELDISLKKIAWEGVCIIAAHQYLRAQKRDGYVKPDGSLKINEKQDFASLGKMVIEIFLNETHHEIGN